MPFNSFRGHTRVITRSWVTRNLIVDTLHDHLTEPGLTRLDATGTVGGISWYECGAPQAAVTVVFVHGYGLAAESYYDQVNYLRGQDVRALLMDVRGHGLSRHVPAEECTMNGAADDVLSVIAERAPTGPLIIVGHSLGGMIVQNLVRRAPQEVYQRIGGVMLIASSMQPFSETGTAILLRTKIAESLFNTVQRLPNRVNRLRRSLAQSLAPIFAAALTGFPQMEQVQFHVGMLLDTPAATFAGFYDELLEHDEYAAAQRLAQLPGTIIVGTMDIVTPRAQAEEIAKHWPGAKLVEVERAGHMVILEEPAAIARELQELIAGTAGTLPPGTE